MARAVADDGVELHWEERGAGPAVVMAAYWSYEPSVWEPLAAELERDHRVIRYDERGTGRSERTGPFDLERSTSDMECVLEAASAGPAVAVGIMDGTNKAVRLAARRPDLVSHVVSSGGAPIGREAISGYDSMIASNTVVAAFMQQLETDYRGAVRGVVESANPQMSGPELRERVMRQTEHVPMETAAARVRVWSDDEAVEKPGRELGDRLVIHLTDAASGGWFPGAQAMQRLLREHFPDAVIEVVADGLISRPDLTAAAVRARSRANVESAP